MKYRRRIQPRRNYMKNRTKLLIILSVILGFTIGMAVKTNSISQKEVAIIGLIIVVAVLVKVTIYLIKLFWMGPDSSEKPHTKQKK